MIDGLPIGCESVQQRLCPLSWLWFESLGSWSVNGITAETRNSYTSFLLMTQKPLTNVYIMFFELLLPLYMYMHKELIQLVLELLHTSSSGGFLGVRTRLKAVKDLAVWKIKNK